MFRLSSIQWKLWNLALRVAIYIFLNYMQITSYAFLSSLNTIIAQIKPIKQKPTEVNRGGPKLYED